MICPQCNNYVDDNSRFCQFCGRNFQQQNVPNTSHQRVQPRQAVGHQPTSNNVYNYQQQYDQARWRSNAPAKSKSNAVLWIIIAVLATILIAVGVIFFLKKDDSDGGGTSRKKDRSSSETKAAVTTTVDTTVTTTEAVTTTAFIPTTTAAPVVTEAVTAAPTTAPPPAQPVVTSPPEPQKSETEMQQDADSAAAQEASTYSTFARPSFSEFEWCYGQNGLVYSPPDDATLITNSYGYSGGWKAMVIYNPTNYSGTYMRELDNVFIEIGTNGGDVAMTIDWYYMSIDSTEDYYEDDMEDSYFSGRISGNGFTATGQATVKMNWFWKTSSNEFALGTIDLSDGTSAYIALYR